MVATFNIGGNRGLGKRSVTFDGLSLEPGPESAPVQLDRSGRTTVSGTTLTRMTGPPMLVLSWPNVVADFPVAAWFRAIERALLAPANMNEIRLYNWGEVLHNVIVDEQPYVAYVTGYETAEEAKPHHQVSGTDIINEAHTWTVRLNLALASWRTMEDSGAPPASSTLPKGATFKSFQIKTAGGYELHMPSAIRWNLQRTAQTSVGGETMVQTQFREPGEMLFTWNALVDTIPGYDPYSTTDSNYIMLTRIREFFAIATEVELWGNCPTDGVFRQIADARVLSLEFNPLPGMPPRYDATIRLALRAAQ